MQWRVNKAAKSAATASVAIPRPRLAGASVTPSSAVAGWDEPMCT
jgi:hypothetical protein